MKSENRHHRRRKIAKAKRVLEMEMQQFSLFYERRDMTRWIRKKARTPKSCSCDMCCNPRRCRGADHDPHRDKRQVNYEADQDGLYRVED